MSTDVVATTDASNGLAEQMMAELEALVTGQELLGTGNAGSGAEFVMGIMDSILAAESIEDIFNAQDAGAGLVSSKDYLDRPFSLQAEGITWNRSSEEYRDAGYFPYWAMLNVVDLEDGEERVISCGAPSACTVIRKLESIGALNDPMTLKFVGKQAGKGTVVTIRPYKVVVPDGKRSSKK